VRHALRDRDRRFRARNRSAAGQGPEVAILELQPAEAECLAIEAAAFAQALPDPTARGRYLQLAEVATSGTVPDELVAPLETMLELVFETGRPSNRALLQSIFGKTPRGKGQSAAAREVTRALQALQGQTITDLRLSSAGPGLQTLVIETDGCRVSLELSRTGTRITSLEAG
jgi:hypothetical protein